MRAIYSYINILFLFVLITSCQTTGADNVSLRPKGSSTPTKNTIDIHSYSNIDEIRTTHLHLDFDVNFDNHSIYGIARHEMENFGADTAIFDIKGLEIQRVTTGKKNEVPTDFVIGEYNDLLGQALSVKITPEEKHVNIYYKTTDKTEAIDWLAPELTAGKKHPFMYTQGQAILTRSWIPLQDTPSNRITYSADVKVPAELMALMSAENPTKKTKDGRYHFEMKQPIPCYLIALAIGDLTYKKLGANCGVYSEPELIAKCAYEFVDLPKMIEAAEKLYGKYQWEQYDVIVLPYSFPFGGMENPRLTFANPTLLAGDRSLVSVIAHELAHSWSGNLVTNSTWNDFWLNEGFTVYFENRIMEEIYGVETADMLALIEFQELRTEMAAIKESEHPEDTHLKLDLDGRSPDDGMTSIAYVKGAFFLKTLEKAVGRKAFDKFLNNYFSIHAFQTITTETFEAYLNKKLLVPNKITFNTKEWLYESGLPSNCVKISSPRFIEVQKLADDFANGKDIFKKPKKGKALTRDKYITQEWQAFIRRLPEKINPKQLKNLDDQLNFKNWGNSEIMAEWYILGINSGYTAILPDMKRFLMKVGRRKFLAPIYKVLAQKTADLKWAREVYELAKGNYHFVSRSTIETLLYPEKV
jgi:leukotriene-A4 hydrolase